VHKGLSIPQAVLIFADEAAAWKVAGLPQIDRIELALNDFFRRSGMREPVPVIVRGITAPASRANIRLTSDLESLGTSEVLVLSTRIVLDRNSLVRAFESFPAQNNFPALIVDASEIRADSGAAVLKQLRVTEREAVASAGDAGERDWGYLAQKDDVARCARQLFRRTTKPQDGVVSRFLNRPLSRSLSQLLVRFPLLPNQLTILLMALPVAGAILLLRGDYFGFALGAILFHLHSALDGCDGEIARVKYLESESGRKLDALCDRFSTLLLAISLGFGLSRQPGNIDALRWIYTAEGVGAALFIGIAETLLTRTRIEDDVAAGRDRYGSYLTNHRQSFNQGDQLKLWMIKHTGMLSLGQGATSFFGEMTKRDVFNFAFMLLAVCGLASWVLHILALCACVILVLALKETLTPTLDANSAA
jgi:phosphatidylglycerophosphate synthase